MKTMLVLLWAVPLAAGLWLSVAGYDGGDPQTPGPAGSRLASRTWAMVVSFAVFGASSLVFLAMNGTLMPGLPTAEIPLGGISAVMLPVVSALAALGLLGAPRLDMNARVAALVLVTEAMVLCVVVSGSILALSGAWVLSLVPLTLDAWSSQDRALRRATTLLLASTALPMVVATFAMAWIAASRGVPAPFEVGTLARAGVLDSAPRWVGAMFVLAAVARMGVFPFHVWLPVVVERGRVPLAIPAIVSPLGSFALAHVGLSLFPSTIGALRPLLLVMGATSAIYGALLALGQHDARRQLGFLFVSIAGFLLSGLASPEAQGVSGALFHDVGATLAMTGLLVLLRGLEVRTGIVDMRRLGGLATRAPMMATLVLVLGLSTVGFPGTATFVSEDLLVQGLLHEHAWTAVLLLSAGALNGVSLVRSFKRIFLGAASRHAPAALSATDLLPRERVVALSLTLAVLAGGFMPAPLLAIRAGVIAEMRSKGPLPNATPHP